VVPATLGNSPVMGALRMLLVTLWSVAWISLALLGLLLTFQRGLPLLMARRWWAPGVLALSGVRLNIRPLPAVTWAQPHIFVMNHQSMMDIPVVFAALPVDVRFVAKESLKYIPFLGWYIWATGMIFVDRKNRQRSIASMSRAAEKIRAGANILVFPEGTRSRDGELQAFKRGAFVLALESQVPVVPLAVEGTRRVLASGGFTLQPGEVQLQMGTPIPTAGRSLEERAVFSDEVHAHIRQMLFDLQHAGTLSNSGRSEAV
jgi:1-acyl-sn-glycerol-3-phosphate acyltransferase